MKAKSGTKNGTKLSLWNAKHNPIEFGWQKSSVYESEIAVRIWTGFTGISVLLPCCLKSPATDQIATRDLEPPVRIEQFFFGSLLARMILSRESLDVNMTNTYLSTRARPRITRKFRRPAYFIHREHCA
jgi:hypothetical protein